MCVCVCVYTDENKQLFIKRLIDQKVHQYCLEEKYKKK